MGYTCDTTPPSSLCQACGTSLGWGASIPYGGVMICNDCMKQLLAHMQERTKERQKHTREFLKEYFAVSRKHGMRINADSDGELFVEDAVDHEENWSNEFPEFSDGSV